MITNEALGLLATEVKALKVRNPLFIDFKKKSSLVLQHSRIRHCHCYGMGSIPGPETSTCHGHRKNIYIYLTHTHTHTHTHTIHAPWDSFFLKATLPKIVFCFLCFLEPHQQPMEVPRLGIELELQLPATAIATQDPSHVCDLHHSSWQRRILNLLSKARDQTCILTDASQVR